jgi:hypothetical protein
LILIIIGILALAGSLSADLLGLGVASEAIGWKQLLGAGVGLVVALVGVFLTLKK